MKQRKDKDGAPSASNESLVPNTDRNTESGKKASKHEYDAGGMAGQKAGIVEDIEQEAANVEPKGSKKISSTEKGSTSSKQGSKKS